MSRQIRLIVWGRYWTWGRAYQGPGRRPRVVLLDRGETWTLDTDEQEWFSLVGLQVNR